MKKTVTFIIPNSKNEADFIGFDNKNFSCFVFPPQYLEDNSDLSTKKIEAKKIIGLIKKVKHEYYYGGLQNELLQFDSMIWLILDFINRGYYHETENITKVSNSGSINWKKTIIFNSVYFQKRGLICKDFVRNRKNFDSNNILSEIYKACLNYSVKFLGFLFNVFVTEYSIFDIEKDKDYLLYFLNRELRNTFKDYKKTLIEHLITIISNHTSRNKSSGFSVHDKEFEYVLEYLLSEVFGTHDVSKFYNEYIYQIDKVEKDASKLRPDIILVDDKNKNCYILDAKFYNYGYSSDLNDLPKSKDISKQISYNNYLRNSFDININLKKYKDEGYKVMSAFILPTSFKNKNDFIKDIGIARSKANKDNNEDFVHVLLIDLKKLIDRYYAKKKNESFEELVKSIKEYEKDFN